MWPVVGGRESVEAPQSRYNYRNIIESITLGNRDSGGCF